MINPAVDADRVALYRSSVVAILRNADDWIARHAAELDVLTAAVRGIAATAPPAPGLDDVADDLGAIADLLTDARDFLTTARACAADVATEAAGS